MLLIRASQFFPFLQSREHILCQLLRAMTMNTYPVLSRKEILSTRASWPRNICLTNFCFIYHLHLSSPASGHNYTWNASFQPNPLGWLWWWAVSQLLRLNLNFLCPPWLSLLPTPHRLRRLRLILYNRLLITLSTSIFLSTLFSMLFYTDYF